MPRKKYLYTSITDDMVETANQQYKIKDSHVWHREGGKFRFMYQCAYSIFFAVSWFYTYIWLGVRFVNKEALSPWAGKSLFIYGNHTLPFGDVALTITLNYPNKVSAMMSPANFGIPVIGKVLEWANMLPVPTTQDQHEDFHKGMDSLIDEGTAIAIYPEAHVWPFYTHIRPSSAQSFSYPVRYGVPVFCSTVTYQRRRFFRRPKVTVYIDGPFFPEMDGEKDAKSEKLRDQIYAAMVDRSSESTYEYAAYRKVHPAS